MLRKVTISFLLIFLVGLIGTYLYLPYLNDYQSDGEISLKGLESEVKVIRDEKGMPYIYADNLRDALTAQGFVMAQDRLFQMQLTKLFAEGRISELAGKKALGLDKKHRSIGFLRIAERHALILDDETRGDLQAFVNGINQFIERDENLHIEFGLAKLKPERWRIETSLAILYYMGWTSTSNMNTELLSLKLVEKLGKEKFKSIYPIHTNPEDSLVLAEPNSGSLDSALMFAFGIHEDSFKNSSVNNPYSELSNIASFWSEEANPNVHWGSNFWVLDGSRTESGKPILAGDPHLDTRILPGTLYASAIILPDNRIMGATIPGIYGMILGKSDYVASSLTNAYMDMQDLVIEQVDPNNANNFMEYGNSVPFRLRTETLFFREDDGSLGEEEFTVRSIKNKIVLNDGFAKSPKDYVLSLRWSPLENMKPSLGVGHLLKSKSVNESIELLKNATMACHNVALADSEGDIARITIGSLPKRHKYAGIFPLLRESPIYNWKGFVPNDSTPQQTSSKSGWLASANNKSVLSDYPYYVSNHFSPGYRYERLQEYFNMKDVYSPTDLWELQRDCKNMLAERIAPIFAKVLMQDTSTAEMGELLANWDYIEDLKSVKASIFQRTYSEFAKQVYLDELGEELGMEMLKEWYFWQERLEKMILDGESDWFDDISTTEKETMADLMIRSAKSTKTELTKKIGSNITAWQWGKIHTISFVNPLRREGFGSEWFGKTAPMAGSGETLYRAKTNFDTPENVHFSASIRMVADFADSDKILAVQGGGEVGRTFHPHSKDQIQPYMNGMKTYWWFSDEMIQKHKHSELLLKP
ncbi:MAG: penicillin amidase [Flammeovirgaceae bacterium]|jgi:penicillin amidase